MLCTRHRCWRLRAKRRQASLVTGPAWSLVLSPSGLFSSNEISINMLDENDEKDTPAECVRQKMLSSQINSPQFKFSLASYKPVSRQICSVHSIYMNVHGNSAHSKKVFFSHPRNGSILKKKQQADTVKLWKYQNIVKISQWYGEEYKGAPRNYIPSPKSNRNHYSLKKRD